ncbi:putative nuclease HARBI1 [Prorops nasuta]|uniref:putative nuclease HARBI1 n=1 Tax=Prorops nasuta TaxID=863751 RepID=UPI0034CEAB3D
MEQEIVFNREELEEEAEEDPPRQHRTHVYLTRKNYFDLSNEENFQRRFRLNKVQFLEIFNQIEPKIHMRQWNKSIPLTIRLLVALRFYATGCFLLVAADFTGISEKSAQQIVHQISAAISELRPKYIKLPQTSGEIMRITNDNFHLSGMIRVIGAIDCIHEVKTLNYSGTGKGFFSLNVQCLVNSRLQFMDIVVRWPGSAHDNTIFENSRLKFRFDNFEFENGIILGDRGYRNQRYVITTLANPQTPAEVLYNEAHIRTRCMVERCFGVWGRRFPVLTIGSPFKTPERTMNVIMATAILHNIIRRDKLHAKPGMETYYNIPEVFSPTTENDRQFLIDNYFSRIAEQ